MAYGKSRMKALPTDSGGDAVEQRTGAASSKAAGWSTVAFGVSLLASTVAGTVLFDACIIDLLAIVVVVLSFYVLSGSRKAAKWLSWIMVAYALVWAIMIVGSLLTPWRITVGGRPVPEPVLPWALGFIAAVGIWAVINFFLLRRAITQAREAGVPPENAIRP